MFQQLHKSFEKKETNLYELQKHEQFSRNILVRSLDTHHLKEFNKIHTGAVVTKGGVSKRYQVIFESKISQEQLIAFIHSEYPKVRKERFQLESHLPRIIESLGQVSCGVRNDNLNDTGLESGRPPN